LESVFPYLTEVLEHKNIHHKNTVYVLDGKIIPKVLQWHSNDVEEGGIHDVLLMQYVLNSHLGQLKQFPAMVLNQLQQHLTINDKLVKNSQLSTQPIDLIGEITDYMRQIGIELHEILQLEKNHELWHVYKNIEKPLQSILKNMEDQGIKIDLAILKTLQQDIEYRLIEISKNIFALTPHIFNLNSPKQLGEMLFETLKMPVVKKTPTGTPSTDESVLEELSLDFPIAKYLMEHRRLSKLQNTYVEKLPQMVDHQHRLHTSFGQTTAVTGRLTSLTPNLQNIPVKTKEGQIIRSSFIAKPDHVLVSADYSQIELRILAHLSEDSYLIDAFKNDLDIHRATAAHLFHQGDLSMVQDHERRYAKAINFGLMYGMSSFGLSKELGLSNAESKEFMEKYFNQYPQVLTFMESIKQFAQQHGYVTTITGRKIHVPDINSSKHVLKQAGQRAAINAPMQGSSSDLIKLAMVQLIQEKPEIQNYLLLQVHDELIFEVPQNEVSVLKPWIQKTMENIYDLCVPLKVSISEGKNWEEAH
jgi:DNA polymerase-1